MGGEERGRGQMKREKKGGGGQRKRETGRERGKERRAMEKG